MKSLTAIPRVMFLFWLLMSNPAECGENFGTPAQKQELKTIAAELRGALIRKDQEGLLKYDIKKALFPGGEDAYTVDKQELSDPKSLLSCYLFDTGCAREQVSSHGGQSNPFYQRAIIDFFKESESIEVEVFFWPVREDYRIASVVFFKPSFKKELAKTMRAGWPSKGWPYEKWAKEFVACDFILNKEGWRYYAGIFKIASDD